MHLREHQANIRRVQDRLYSCVLEAHAKGLGLPYDTVVTEVGLHGRPFWNEITHGEGLPFIWSSEGGWHLILREGPLPATPVVVPAVDSRSLWV